MYCEDSFIRFFLNEQNSWFIEGYFSICPSLYILVGFFISADDYCKFGFNFPFKLAFCCILKKPVKT